jgi:speckle-type POZ protein
LRRAPKVHQEEGVGAVGLPLGRLFQGPLQHHRLGGVQQGGITVLKGNNKEHITALIKQVLKKTKKEEEDASPAMFVAVPPSDMHRQLEHLLLSGEGADVTLEVGGGTFRAHRSILAARSPVFKAELFGPMEEGTSACMRVKDIEQRVFKVLLHFIYTDSLPDIAEGETMVVAQHLLVAADRYSLERAKVDVRR